jgi:hypothetical protein
MEGEDYGDTPEVIDSFYYLRIRNLGSFPASVAGKLV